MAEQFNYLDFFREEIRNESATIKINALNNIHLVASALGPKKTVDELLPCVNDVMMDEAHCHDDEFLFTMANPSNLLSPPDLPFFIFENVGKLRTTILIFLVFLAN